MKTLPIVIFGAGDIAQLANYYFEADSEFEPVAFTVDREYFEHDEFEGRRVIPADEVVKEYPPDRYGMFVALSYSRMNHDRETKYLLARSMGYRLVSYVSSRCTWLTQYPHGDNCFILEDNTVQPFVKIGSNVMLWSGNHIGHHSTIHDHNFVSSHVVISGHCEIEPFCFLGVNSTIAHWIRVGQESLIGAGVTITKDTAPGGVWVPAQQPRLLDRRSIDVKL
ncbi:MAG: acetyltransferase [Thermoanaerobaculia bacterium]|jgi:sugar O-acyltransferase (sialic acid O-acetyltransferase NeuD family)